MKQKDLPLIIAIVLVSGVFSLLISNVLMGSESKTQKAEVVEPIIADFVTPDKDYFNETSLNPTRQIQIGGDSNENPFEGEQQ